MPMIPEACNQHLSMRSRFELQNHIFGLLARLQLLESGDFRAGEAVQFALFFIGPMLPGIGMDELRLGPMANEAHRGQRS